MSVFKDQWGNVNTYNLSKVCDFAGIARRLAELVRDERSADGASDVVTIVDKSWGDKGYVRKFQVDADTGKVVEVPLTVNVIV